MTRIVRAGLCAAALSWAACGGAETTNNAFCAVSPPFSYPCAVGRVSFPADEGLHSTSERPMTLAEWHAHYAHLTADDGSRYLLFTTFITFDPLEEMIGGKFPHAIATLIDVTKGKTWFHRDMERLKTFAPGHADVETAQGDYFRWKGADKPFQYDFHVAWNDANGNVSVTTELKMVKPPLAVNGSGYIKVPKGESGYYCQTRVEAKGELTVNGVKKQVSGVQWIDRQWLGVTFAANLNYYYDWWALQLTNNEEAIMFRIKDFETNAIAMTWLDINRADGKREHVDKFTLTDLPSGWKVSAPSAGWDLKILPACKGQQTWQSCDITGTIHGKSVTGLAAVELAHDALNDFRKTLNPNIDSRADASGRGGIKRPSK